jgi:hypothetical protein
MRVGDVVTVGDEGEHFVIIGGASRDNPESWLQNSATRLPAGWHVQSLSTGHLATYTAHALLPVGRLVDTIDGLLPRARARVGS